MVAETTAPATIEDEDAALDAQWRTAQGAPETAPPAEETRTDVSPDAAPASTPEDEGIDTAAFEAEYAALQKEAEGKEGPEAKAPESVRPAGPDPLLVEQGRQQARALHARVQESIDAYEQELVAADVHPALAARLVKEMKDRTNELYAGLLPTAGYEHGFQIEQQHHAAIQVALAQNLGSTQNPDGTWNFSPEYRAFWNELAAKADAKTGQTGYADVFNHFADTKYKGWKSPDDFKNYGKNQWIDGRRAAEKVLRSARNVPNGISGVPTQGSGSKGWYDSLTSEQYEAPENQAAIRAYEMAAMTPGR